MHFMKKVLLFVFALTCLQAMAQKKKPGTVKPKPKMEAKAPMVKKEKEEKLVIGKEKLVEITTDSGIIVVKLYDSTPVHRDNFVKLVTEHFYDSLLFHRVIAGFMMQGGDPQSRLAQPGEMLGAGGGELQRIPAEFNVQLVHKKGALAAARDNNPALASSGCQFYIVQGKKVDDALLNQMEQQVAMNKPGFKYSAKQRALYKTIGGTPFLDMSYTVFGEVVKGIAVVDKICNMQKNNMDRPLTDIRMKMRLLN